MDQVRVEGFFEARCQELENEVKALVWNNAELDKKNKGFVNLNSQFDSVCQHHFLRTYYEEIFNCFCISIDDDKCRKFRHGKW